MIRLPKLSAAPSQNEPNKTWLVLAGLFLFFAGSVWLAFHNIADNDLWAKLAIGGWLWEKQELLQRDVFAFTETLPRYVDHEWGSGTVFFLLLKALGPEGLMLAKLTLGLGSVAWGILAARRQNVSWPVVLALAALAGSVILGGFIVVLRAQVFTYFFFAVALVLLERLREDKWSAAGWLPLIMLLWTNLHGGFVAGLGAVGIYTLWAWWKCHRRVSWLVLAASCGLATFLNPYGMQFWQYLLPAVLRARPYIAEWGPLPLVAVDTHWNFRILFLLTIVAIIFNWKKVEMRSVPGLVLLALTATLAWRSRRHAPLFSLCALVFAAPYYQACGSWFFPRSESGWRTRLNGGVLLLFLTGGLAIWMGWRYLPGASLGVLAPVGGYPVREVDILERAAAKGHLALPFEWGSYASWRLYPSIQVSMDGRDEAAYPESTFLLNLDFTQKKGANWSALIRKYEVDFIILDLRHEGLRPEDLAPFGYQLIWRQAGCSALLCLARHTENLRQSAASLPAVTIQPLTAEMLKKW